MGAYLSSAPPNGEEPTTTETLITAETVQESTNQIQTTGLSTPDNNDERSRQFAEDLSRIHEKRRQIIAQKKQEFEELRAEVQRLKQENNALKSGQYTPDEQLCAENEELRRTILEKNATLEQYSEMLDKNRELRCQIAEMQQEVQHLNTEVCSFEQQRTEYQAHVVALKDVIKVSKQMIQIREAQLKELKEKVENIESTLADREINILSQDLRSEYERQIQNIRNLKILYEERQRGDAQEKRELNHKLDEARKELEENNKTIEELRERIQELENENSKKYDEIKSLESNLGLSQAESRDYQAELAVINQLFSEILLGFNNTQDIDLDKMKRMLEENHGLLQNIVLNEISKEVSYALPKLLLDLVYQVDEKNKIQPLEEGEENEENKTSEPSTSSIHQLNSADEIAENLPKVWKVLIELLSHQKIPSNEISEEENTSERHCYKVVETPKGPNLVASVSQTFIRLKDLILEKKALEKETNNLKQLNTHLESRLSDQEKRLETVTSELSKTWHVVGKLQKQHQLLHTQEKILRYELAEKRKLLGELREELEYSREKWQEARVKNSATEREWKKLRQEFASRRNTIVDDSNNSCESGFSDDREGSSDDDETDISESCPKPEETSTSETVQNAETTGENLTEAEHTSDNVTETEHTSENVTEAESVPEISTESELNSEHATEADTLPETNPDSEPISETVVQADNLQELVQDLEESIEGSVLEEPSPVSLVSNQPSTSNCHITLEQRLAARDERLTRLELEATQLVNRITNTNLRSDSLSSKLDDLHPPEEVPSTAVEETQSTTVEETERQNTDGNDDEDNSSDTNQS